MRTFIAVGHLKARYPEEANNVALDIKTTKLGELALQHRANAQHQHPISIETGCCQCVFFGRSSFLG